MCAKEKLSGLLKICQKYGYIAPFRGEKTVLSRVPYGPLGMEMKKNIFDIWWKTLTMATDVNVFPVSTPVLKWQKEGTTKTGSIQMRSSLSEDTMGHYLSVLQTVNCQLPFGIVHSGLCFKSDLLVNLNSDADILMNLDVSSQHNDRNEGKIASSLISSVWNPLEKTHLMLMFFCSPKSFSSWLEYWQKHRLSWWRKVLRIHHQLAPYKVTITASGATNKLRDLAIYITRQLRKSNVAVFPNPDLYCVSSLDSQFIHFDEMGIPYCIVLSERTLKTGIAGLRNRDTTITEQVHVKEMKNKLLYYLQMQ
ncbi:DNA polymerase subunit gamma-2, mitochondrial-like isoform X3 [Limulus polyphemus]|uniref:DNA polymerase subunit gamma-2, mitochondrial-like isoform X3 n=1 Tax=Limulus polyphemus TaxID=6850 RepID=A0ABM1TE38_LIMPO|nr:DNA polymerase subunit gamma-2, mitochondrial-like isoform X3 [Limulus polyphemus]